MIRSRAEHAVAQALAAVDAAVGTPLEKVEMLVEIGMDLQRRPQVSSELEQALLLYERALELCPESELLPRARIRVLKASALRSIPAPGPEALLRARVELEGALEQLAAAA